VPVGEWIARRGAEIGPLVARQPGVVELCRPGSVEALFRARSRRAGFAAWVLLFFALWYRCHVEGRPVDGDAFDALGER